MQGRLESARKSPIKPDNRLERKQMLPPDKICRCKCTVVSRPSEPSFRRFGIPFWEHLVAVNNAERENVRKPSSAPWKQIEYGETRIHPMGIKTLEPIMLKGNNRKCPQGQEE